MLSIRRLPPVTAARSPVMAFTDSVPPPASVTPPPSTARVPRLLRPVVLTLTLPPFTLRVPEERRALRFTVTSPYTRQLSLSGLAAVPPVRV